MMGCPCRSSSPARATMAPRTAYWVSRTAWLTSWSVRDMARLSGWKGEDSSRRRARPDPLLLLLRELDPRQRQLLAHGVAHPREAEVERLERLHHRRGDHQAGEPLVVGRDH